MKFGNKEGAKMRRRSRSGSKRRRLCRRFEQLAPLKLTSCNSRKKREKKKKKTGGGAGARVGDCVGVGVLGGGVAPL